MKTNIRILTIAVIILLSYISINAQGIYLKNTESKEWKQLVSSNTITQENYNNNYLEFTLGQQVTCSQTGVISKIGTLYSNKKSKFGFSVLFQHSYMKFKGVQFEYKYVINCSSKINLYFDYTLAYFDNIKKTKNYNRLTHNRFFSEDVRAGIAQPERFNILESYAGFGLHVKVLKKIYINSGIGVGGQYSSMQTEDYRQPQKIFNEDLSCGLIFKLGITGKIILN